MGAVYMCFMLHRLRPKGLNGWMANNSPDRLTHPLIRRGDKAMHRTGSLTQQMTIQPKVPSKAGKI